MEAMAKNLRVLRRQISDPALRESSVALLGTMEANALKAKELVPEKSRDVPEPERDKFIAAYRTKMDEFTAALRAIAVQVREGRFEAAKEALGKLQTLKRAGHEQFSSESEEE